MLRIRILATLILIASLARGAWAQGGATGAISGTVQDASGAVIQNAKVNIQSEGTGEVVRQVTSDSSGLFTATLLPVGTYTIEVSAAGFPVTRPPTPQDTSSPARTVPASFSGHPLP